MSIQSNNAKNIKVSDWGLMAYYAGDTAAKNKIITKYSKESQSSVDKDQLIETINKKAKELSNYNLFHKKFRRIYLDLGAYNRKLSVSQKKAIVETFKNKSLERVNQVEKKYSLIRKLWNRTINFLSRSGRGIQNTPGFRTTGEWGLELAKDREMKLSQLENRYHK